MLLNKINHIGVAVKSIEAALPFYKAMVQILTILKKFQARK